MAFKYLALMLLTLSLPMRVMAQDADLTLGVLSHSFRMSTEIRFILLF